MLFVVNRSVDATVVPPGLVNVHHELNTPAGESNLCCLSVRIICTSGNWQGTHAPHPRNPLGAPILIPVRLSLHYLGSLAIPRSLHLHICAVFHSQTEKSSPSIATMASGSIGTSSISINLLGEHTERRVCDPTSVHIFLWCNI